MEREQRRLVALGDDRFSTLFTGQVNGTQKSRLGLGGLRGFSTLFTGQVNGTMNMARPSLSDSAVSVPSSRVK